MALRQHKTTSYEAHLPEGVKWLIIVNSAIFVPYYLAGPAIQASVNTLFGLVAGGVLRNFYVWQVFTYMFLHGGVWHLVFNMLGIWFCGARLEENWGRRRFLSFYFLSGIAAGVCVLVANAATGNWYVATIGSSGAFFGILAAFGVLYADEPVLMFFIFPMKAKYMVMILGGIEFLMIFGPVTGVSNIAHLGGMVFGYLYVKRRLPSVRLPDLAGPYRRWRFERNKRRFQVYMRGKNPRGPWKD
jgi:membrane associated rhomboid family serine protease